MVTQLKPYKHYHSKEYYLPLSKFCESEGAELKTPQVSPCSSLRSVLDNFESYQLHELNNANLMNRVDSKFLLPISFLPALLEQLKSQYKMLDIAGSRYFSYHNQYFDTPDMNFYLDHHNGKLNRYKVRKRSYVDNATEFLEVKLKNNQKRTIKTRIELPKGSNITTDYSQFIVQEMKRKSISLDVTQQSGYKRIALANEAKAERITFDFDLWFQNKRGSIEVKLPGFFIAELKQRKKNKLSPFYQLMSKHRVFPTSFSKYCIGCALLYPETIKANRFKSVLSRVKQLNRHNPLYTVERNSHD